MLEREHSELSRASRNKKSIFFKRMYHTGSSANELALKAKDDHRSVLQSGRSMIEMLGVLAIIAVLSVGGIAGYSKAMSMWKMNRWSYDFVVLIQNLQTSYLNAGNFGNNAANITSTVVSAGLVPDGMLDKNSKDIFGNQVNVLTRVWNGKYGVRLNLQYNMPAGRTAVECCNKLFEMGQLYKSLWIVWIEQTEYGVCGTGAPKSYIQDMGCDTYNRAKVLEKCKVCATQSCNVLTLLENSI